MPQRKDKYLDMKRIFSILLCVLCLACIPMTVYGQAQIKTKKVMIGDFGTKTMKVVLGSNIMLDEALEREIAGHWRISPYEFCTVDEFEKLKHSQDYYFLLPLKKLSGKDAGLVMLNLFKGGPEKNPEGNVKMTDVASFPISSVNYPSGREFVFLAAALDIMQDYVGKAMNSDFEGYSGFSIYNSPKASAGRRIVFSEEDLSPAIDDYVKAKYFDDGISTDEDADELMVDGGDVLVSFVVAPSEPKRGNRCYKMLIDARTHEMVYFKSHRISESKWVGFQAKDLKAIARGRKK